jgi:hypothetical protein
MRNFARIVNRYFRNLRIIIDWNLLSNDRLIGVEQFRKELWAKRAPFGGGVYRVTN